VSWFVRYLTGSTLIHVTIHFEPARRLHPHRANWLTWLVGWLLSEYSGFQHGVLALIYTVAYRHVANVIFNASIIHAVPPINLRAKLQTTVRVTGEVSRLLR
jgi:hypothetical protein